MRTTDENQRANRSIHPIGVTQPREPKRRTISRRLTDKEVRNFTGPGDLRWQWTKARRLEHGRTELGTALTAASGKRREAGLGGYPAVSLKEARIKADEFRRSLLRDGVDPLQLKLERKRAEAKRRTMARSFISVASESVDIHKHAWRSKKHRGQWTVTIEQYANPVFGKTPIGEITRDQVVRVLLPIWNTKTETAVRLRGRIELVMAYAMAKGLRDTANPATWRGNLSAILPPPRKVTPVEHHPALPWQDIARFMAAVRKPSGMGAKALEFCILTAVRSAEVRGATWQEMDMHHAMWTVPAARTKAFRDHRIPLSAPAPELLRSLPCTDHQSLVFPGTERDKTLSEMTLTKVVRDLNKAGHGFVDRDGRAVVPHGFRSTFRDWCAEMTNYASELCELALSHSVGSAVELAYRRGDQYEKRRALMSDWGAWCYGATNVVALRRQDQQATN